MTAAFELERFAWSDGELEVAGRWRAGAKRRFRRVRLLVEEDGRVRRLTPVSPAPLTATPEGESWSACFRWPDGHARITRAELEVGRDLAVALPTPVAGSRNGTAAVSAPVVRSALAARAPAKPAPPKAVADDDEREREYAALDAAREEARRDREEAEAARRALERERTALERAREEADRVRAEVKAARRDLDHDRARVDAALAELEQERAAIDRARAEVDQARQELEVAPPEPEAVAAPRELPRAPHRRPRPPARATTDPLTFKVATAALAVPVVVALLVILDSI